MKKFILLAASMLAASSAQASVVYSNDFDAEHGGTSALNYNGFSGLTVTSGNVDLVFTPDYGITCAGGSGGCVDLDGTPGPALLSSTSSYAFGGDDVISLSFDMSGNQRGGGSDFWESRLNFAADTLLLEYGYYYNGTQYVVGHNAFTSSFWLNQSDLASDTPFQDITMYVVTGGAGDVSFSFATNSADNVGPILDNVSLDISPVPEPATWAMMIGGFALAGAAMRRRKPIVSFA